MAAPRRATALQLGDPRLVTALRSYPYLAEYMRRALGNVGTPVFYDTYELSYDLKREKWVNVLYPVGKGVFIHVYTPPAGTVSGYRKYVVVEPPRPHPRLLELVEAKLAEVLTERDVTDGPGDKERLILAKLEKVVKVVSERVDYSRLAKREGKIPVHVGDLEYLKYYVLRDKVGLGVLEPFLLDPWLEDITCKGLGPVYVVHKIFGPLESSVEFRSKEELDIFLIRLTERIGKPVSHARPLVDATLPDGSRINIVFGEDVSLQGSNFTIRKFSESPISVTQLIAWNTMDEYLAAYVWMLLNHNMSGFVCGETASGKTTTLNAVAVFIPPWYKVISIEDTAEVRLPHPNWVRELTRDTGAKESSVTMFDLLRAALRQRPNYIIVGEIRGQEAAIAFQAMQTGHPVLSTFHAANVQSLVQRLAGDPIRIPKTFMDNLNFALFQNAVWVKGLLARRVTSVNEIVGYDPKSDSIIYFPVFVWDPVKDSFMFRGRGASHLLENKIAPMRGLSRINMGKIYEELELRARFLRELVKRKVFKYSDVWRAVVKAYELGVDKALERLARDQLL